MLKKKKQGKNYDSDVSRKRKQKKKLLFSDARQ